MTMSLIIRLPNLVCDPDIDLHIQSRPVLIPAMQAAFIPIHIVAFRHHEEGDQGETGGDADQQQGQELILGTAHRLRRTEQRSNGTARGGETCGRGVTAQHGCRQADSNGTRGGAEKTGG